MIKRLSVSDIKDLFNGTSGHFQNADADYDQPGEAWIINYAVAWAKTRPAWCKKFDCDDFAFAFKVACQEAHRIGTGVSDGIAVGVVFYCPDSGGGHAINFAVVGKDKVIYIEPQNGRTLCLTKSELDSRFFVYV